MMSFVTEIPSAADIEKWALQKLLRNEYTTWTVDRSRECFLIAAHKTEALSDQPAREDYYFHHDGKTGVVSFALRLEHEGSTTLVYRWKLISSYGMAYSLQSDPQFLAVSDEDLAAPAHIFAQADGKEALALMQEAFLAYKASLGLQESSTVRIIFDTEAVQEE